MVPYPKANRIARTRHLDNLQLLCGHCNSLKENRPMEYLRARLVRGYV
ncbi:MAG: HNH endonuclease [Chloroflexi bacterium]|nr:HNH endonuclease [Chloroflexota bacterium]